MHEACSDHFEVGGARLWTATRGSGPGGWDDLDDVAATIDDRVTVHRFDQRACRRSTGELAPMTVERALADIETLRDLWGVERWMVGGHSWGANLALAYARANQERVTGVIWIAGTGVDDYWWTAAHAVYRAERDSRLTSAQRQRREELREAVPAAGTGAGALLDELCVLQWSTDFADRQRSLALARHRLRDGLRPSTAVNEALNADWQRYVEEVRPVERLAGFDRPVLIVHGAIDPRPLSIAQHLAAALPNARLEVLAGAGHYPWLETPAELRSVLRAFLEGAA